MDWSDNTLVGVFVGFGRSVTRCKPRNNIRDTYRSHWWPTVGEATLPRPQATGL